MKKIKLIGFSSSVESKKYNAGKKSQLCVRTKCRNFLTSDELDKFESVDVCDNPILEEFQSLFMEQVFSAAHDEDMVSPDQLTIYRSSIAELLHRAGIVSDSKPNASYTDDLGYRTSTKVLGEFHIIDYELPNAV